MVIKIKSQAEYDSLKEKRVGGEPLTIDITPTWLGILPVLLAVHENADVIGRANAMKELQRMADLADKYVAQEKAKTGESE